MALVGWWKLNGDVVDYSPYKWSSTGGGTYTTAPIGQALNNVGIGNIAVHTKLPSSLIEKGSLTISFWLRQHSGHSTPTNYIFGFGNTYLSHGTTTSTWTLTSTYYQQSVGATVTSTVSFTDDQWYHVCIKRNDIGQQFIYVDGVLYDYDAATNFVQWAANGNVNFAIGAASSGSTTGAATYIQYSDFKVFNHELSLKEIRELAKGKMFHVDFEDSVDNIAGHILTASRAVGGGYYHQGTGSIDTNINRIGSSQYYPNATANALTYDGTNAVIKYDESASGHTFAFWINERDYTTPSRQNPFAKAYGGEGTLTLEPYLAGYYNFFWGSAGSDTTPYTASTSELFVTNSSWKHVAIVRDMKGQQISWYSDGQFINSTTHANFYSPKAGTQNFQLFDGYVNYLEGYLDDFRIYATTLSKSEINELYQSKAYLTDFGNFMSKGNVSETDFYYAFDGYLADNMAYDVNVGGAFWNWGFLTGSRNVLTVANDANAWDANITTKRKFNRPAIFYGTIKMDGNTRAIVGWKDNSSGIANTDYVHGFVFNSLTGILSASEDGTVYTATPQVFVSQSVWYDFKIALNTAGASYYYKDPAVHKQWQPFNISPIVAKTEDTLRPALTHYEAVRTSSHDNWAITSLTNQVTYYGDIISNEINEVGHTDNLRAMWSLNFTTSSYTSASGNLYPLTSSTGYSMTYGISQDRIHGCGLLNWTGSGSTDRFVHPTISYGGGSQWTAMCWIYISGSNPRVDILGLSGSSTKILGIDDKGNPFYVNTGSSITDTSLTVSLNNWNHMAWSHAAGKIFFMINGISGSLYTSTPSCSFNCIGLGGSDLSSVFRGRIADVRLYDVSLPASHIGIIYNFGKNTGSLVISGASDNSVYFAKDFSESY